MIPGKTVYAGRLVGLTAAVLAASVFWLGAPLSAKTFVLPHFIESAGRASRAEFTFDTTIFATYTPGLAGTEPGQGAQVSLFVYDSATDEPLLSSTRTAVCNPCVATLDEATRKVAFSLDDLIEAAGGFASPHEAAYALVVVGGDDENVSLQGFVVNSHSGPLDLAVFGFEPQPLASAARVPGEEPSPRRVFVLPHVLETSGRITETQFTFDTQVFMTYTAGLAGTEGGPGATAELYLHDDATGEPMVSATGEVVCNPCSFVLGAGGQGSSPRRKRAIRVDDLIQERGGFASKVVTGYAIVVINGDADSVNVQGFVVNAHTNQFDLSATFTSPQPLASVDRDPKDPPPSPKRTFVLPHALETSGSIASAQYTFDTTIFATYVGGLAGVEPGPGATVNVYLHDITTGEAFRDRNGAEVCNPCTRTLGRSEDGLPPARKVSIAMDTELGDNLQNVSAVIVVSGDHENVSLQGFVVNSHTSPLDVSIAAIKAQPVLDSPGEDPPGGTKSTFVVPHILERSGTIQQAERALDTTITVSYVEGDETPAGSPDAVVELHLFDDSTGAHMQSRSGRDICAPCVATVGPGRRAVTLAIEALAGDAGGLPDASVSGFGVLVVGGPRNRVAIQGHVVTSSSGPFDLSVFGFEPVELAAAARVAGPRFLRGDSNADGRVDIGDPINTLSFLFQGTATPRCLKSADADGRAGVDISDSVYLLQYLFLGGAAPVVPFPACGSESEATEISCESYPQCP